MVLRVGLGPTRFSAAAFETAMFAYFIIRAYLVPIIGLEPTHRMARHPKCRVSTIPPHRHMRQSRKLLFDNSGQLNLGINVNDISSTLSVKGIWCARWDLNPHTTIIFATVPQTVVSTIPPLAHIYCGGSFLTQPFKITRTSHHRSLMVVIPSKPSVRHAAFRRAPRRVVCNTLNINSPQFRRDQSTPRVDSLPYPLFDLAKDTNFVEGFLQLSVVAMHRTFLIAVFFCDCRNHAVSTFSTLGQIGNTSWLSIPTFYWTGNSMQDTHVVLYNVCYFRKLTPSFALLLGMVFNSHSALLPILAIALTRLYCDTVWIDLYHCQGNNGVSLH